MHLSNSTADPEDFNPVEKRGIRTGKNSQIYHIPYHHKLQSKGVCT